MITTGGTIACSLQGGGLTPTLNGEELLSFLPKYKHIADITIHPILNMDSSNIQPEDWVKISNVIYENINRYDGIVIVHGTDTMAYSSSAISFLTLGCINKPVILTGSQVPINQKGSDGIDNLLNSFQVINDGRLKGVFIVFNGYVINGCSATKINSISKNAFRSVNCEYVATFTCDKLIINRLPKRLSLNLNFKINMNKSIFLLTLFPGMGPNMLKEISKMNYKAVIIEGFGVGGIPTMEKSFLPTIELLVSRNIIPIITTQCLIGGTDISIYEVGRMAQAAGAVCAGAMTREALVTKLMWCLAQTSNVKEIKHMLKINYCGELSTNESFFA